MYQSLVCYLMSVTMIYMKVHIGGPPPPARIQLFFTLSRVVEELVQENCVCSLKARCHLSVSLREFFPIFFSDGVPEEYFFRQIPSL